jgi:hypothetical protein
MANSDGLDIWPVAASSRSRSPSAMLDTCPAVRDRAWPGSMPCVEVIASCRGFRSGLACVK